MLKLNAIFERKADHFSETECVMGKTIELPAESYRHFKSHLLGFEPFITENRDWMRVDENNVAHCLLVLGEGGSEGVLVNSEGYDYARYASLVPGARELAAAQQKQEIAEKEQASGESAPLRLRDLFRLGLPNNIYLVHDTVDVGFIPVGGLKEESIDGKAQEQFADLLDARVKGIQHGAYGPEIVLGGIPAQRLSEFDQALADCQITGPVLGM